MENKAGKINYEGVSDQTHAWMEAELRRQRQEIERLRGREQELEEARRVLLTVLEDLDGARREVERARREWVAAFDAVQDPMFVHDFQFRIVRVNRAYAERAGLAIQDCIGRLYWEVFPKRDGPLPSCETALHEAIQTQEEIRFDSGEVFVSRAFPISEAGGQAVYSIHILQDVTEHRRLEAERRVLSEAVRQSAESVIVLDADRCIRYVNPAFERLFGYRENEVKGKPISLIALPALDPNGSPDAVLGKVEQAGSWAGEVVRLAKDGTELPLHLTVAPIRDQIGQITGYIGNLADLRPMTAAMRRIDALRSAIEELSSELDLESLGARAVRAAIEMIGADMGAVAMVETGEDTLRYRWHVGLPDRVPFESLRMPSRRSQGVVGAVLSSGKSVFIEDYPAFEDAVPHMATGIRSIIAAPIVVQDATIGSLLVASLGCALSFDDAQRAVLEAIARQIGIAIQRQRLLDEVRDSELRYQRLFETMIDGFALCEIIVDEAGRPRDYRFLDANPAFERLCGLKRSEIIGKTVLEVLPATESYWIETLGRVALSGESVRFENYARALDKHFEAAAYRPRQGQFAVVFVDVSERVEAQRALRRTNRALRTLSRCNRAVVGSADEAMLLNHVCQAIVDDGGYRSTWVAYLEADGVLRTAASAGIAPAALQALQRSAAVVQTSRLPSFRAVRLRQAVVVSAEEGRTKSLKYARQSGIRSLIALPLLEGDAALGVLTIFAADAHAFDVDERALLEELAGDLAYGIASLRTRESRVKAERAQAETAAQLRKLLQQTIEAIGRTLEKRDPYTGGHQQRVAQLAVAIGRELNWSEQRLEGLRMGGLIHDIGKIYVPSEILNRPGRLSAAEFEIIKTHARVGYEIVEKVDFPWPVAEMVLRHHERLNGSGYPDGLSGEDILPEARILAVADVVEAIASHRPYRPGLGMDAALREISAQRGVLYDAQIVDVCNQLFLDKEFHFAE